MSTRYQDQVMLLRDALYDAIAAYKAQETRYDEDGNKIPKEFFNAFYHSEVVLFGNKTSPIKLTKLQAFVNELYKLGSVDALSNNDAESIVTWINLSLVHFFTQTQERSPRDYSLVKYMIDKLAVIHYEDDDQHPNWTNYDPQRCKTAYEYDGYVPVVYATSSFTNERLPEEPDEQMLDAAAKSVDVASSVQQINGARRRVYTSFHWAKSQGGLLRPVASIKLDANCIISEGSRAIGRVPRTAFGGGEQIYSYKMAIRLQGLKDLKNSGEIANFWVESHGNNNMIVYIERATHEKALTISTILSMPKVVTQLLLDQAVTSEPEIEVPAKIQQMRADEVRAKTEVSLRVAAASIG